MADPHDPVPSRERVHVVTGASAGMGAACVTALADRGEQVLAVARRGEVLAELADGRPTVAPVVADVGTDHGRAAVLEVLDDDARVGSIVHGAATAVDLTPWTDLDPDELTAHFAVHVAAPIALTSTLRARHGVDSIVLFDSYSATQPRNGWSAYSILKAGAQMAFRAAAEELDDVVVIRAYPGAVATPLLDRVLDADRSIPATGFYRRLADHDRVSTADAIGERVADLVTSSAADLRSHIAADEVFHIGLPAELD